jgi:serine/threonine protein kinase
MATTFKARRLADDRVVALKVPASSCLRDPTFAVRFLQEAHLGERLRHPNIVRILETGEDRGVPFLTMEYLVGLTLQDALAYSGRIAVARALQVAQQVASALEHAHARQVIPRDLKPANLMVRSGEGVKVMDFGVAKVVDQQGVTASNIFLGTPTYSAPETIDSRHIDHRADLYALGIILFELLVGSPPFTGRSAVEVLIKHRSEPLPDADSLAHPIPPAIYRLIKHLTDKDPGRRLPDARSLRLALEMLQARRDRPEPATVSLRPSAETDAG